MELQNTLPEFIVREQTCCFTGHRLLARERREDLTASVDRVIRGLYKAGYRYFMAGGALGFDTLAETEVLRAARFDKDVKLILVLPCRDQTLRWARMPGYMEHLRRYKQILGMADYVVYMNDFYTETCMRERNQYMIDHSSVCVAYYNGASRSGAGQTYRMAVAGGLEIVNLWTDIPASEQQPTK